MPDNIVSEAIEISDPTLLAHANRIVNIAILSMQKGIAQQADPAHYPIDDPQSLEQAFSSYVQQLPTVLREPMLAVGMAQVMADPATRAESFGDLANVNLSSPARIDAQAEALPSAAASTALDLTNLASAFHGPILDAVGMGPVIVGLKPQQADSIVRFSLDQVHCDTPTTASWTLFSKHFDEIAAGGIAIGPFGTLQKVAPVSLGQFPSGATRPGLRPFMSYPIDSTGNWSKTFSATIVLAETHLGDIFTYLDKLVELAKTQLTSLITAAAGALIGAEVGAALGTVIPGLGTIIGAVVGAVVGYLVTKVVDWLKGLFGFGGGGDHGPGPMLATLCNTLSVVGPGSQWAGSTSSPVRSFDLKALGGEYHASTHWEITWGSPIANDCWHRWYAGHAIPPGADGGVPIAPNKGALDKLSPVIGAPGAHAFTWYDWESLGGVLNFDLAVSSWGPNRLDLFGVGTDDTLFHRWFDGGWHPWERLDGKLTSGPAAVSWGPNRIDVVARGGDNAIYHKWWDGAAWRGWESLKGDCTSPPAIASWASGRLDVFVAGRDKALYHKWFDGHWHEWESLGGGLTSGPAAVSWGPDRIDVVVRGGDNAIWHRWWNGVGWQPWESLGGAANFRPGISSWGPGRLDLFAAGTDDVLYHKWFDGDWHDWESLGGRLTSAPAAVSWGANRIDVVTRGA